VASVANAGGSTHPLSRVLNDTDAAITCFAREWGAHRCPFYRYVTPHYDVV
jgi:hypothetical protein